MGVRNICSVGLATAEGLDVADHRFSEHWCPRQYRSHFSTVLVATIAQDRSPARREVHQAAVLFPLPLPIDRQVSREPLTSTCPSRDLPTWVPIRRTKASRAASALALGHGWLLRQLPSISRAAIPERRIRGPSAHHSGPSPSHTRVGVQGNEAPAGTTAETAARIVITTRD